MDKYNAEELKYIKDHFRDDGCVAVAHHLGRTTSAVRTCAHRLGITLRARHRSAGDSAEHNMIRTYRHKPDYSKNESADKLDEVIANKRAEDLDKVMLKVTPNAWVQVPRDRATPEYAEMIRQKWARNKKYYG